MGYLKQSWHGFSRYKYLLQNLVQRDIKVKYRRSVLGILWSILNPLLMMLVQALVFSSLFKQGGVGTRLVSTTGQIPSFPVYLLSGMLMFNFFSEATQLAMDSVLANSALIKKVYIPKYIFPLEKVIFSFVNAMFSLIALVLVLVITRSPLTPWAFLFFVPMLLLMVFNLGVGLILSALTVFFRDIKHFYGVVVLALNYLTPLFYAEESLFKDDARMAYIMHYVLRVNPLYWYVNMFRQVVVYGFAPSIEQWLFCGGWAVFVLTLGLIIFKKAQDRFILFI